MNRFLLLICIVLFSLSLFAQPTQDLRSDESFFNDQVKLYQRWLENTGLGDYIQFKELGIRERSLAIYLEFKSDDIDWVVNAWGQMKRAYEENSALSLEQQLFYKAEALMEVRQSSLSAELYDTYDFRKTPLFERAIYFDEGIVKTQISDPKSKTEYVELPAPKIAGDQEAATQEFRQRYSKERVFNCIVQNQDDCDSYRTYLNKHPRGEFRLLARQKIAPCEAEERMVAAWRNARARNECAAYEAFKKEYPNSDYASLVPSKLKELGCNATGVNLPNNMTFVAGGSFQMGDQFGDGNDDEKPVHSVTLSDFYLGTTEVTLAKFSEFIESSGYTTSAEKHGTSYIWTGSTWEDKAGINWRHDEQGNERTTGKWNHPVIHISWLDAIAYCNWRSKEELLTPVYTISGTSVSANWSANGYRLPTEAEWEYAARSGGRKEKWSGTSSESDLTAYANKSGKDDGYEYTAPVGSFQPNGLGLSDMSGNVWEWCWDWYASDYYGKSTKRNPRGPSQGSYRVIRGGVWHLNSWFCRAAIRSYNTPEYRSNIIGFRLARSF